MKTSGWVALLAIVTPWGLMALAVWLLLSLFGCSQVVPPEPIKVQVHFCDVVEDGLRVNAGSWSGSWLENTKEVCI